MQEKVWLNAYPPGVPVSIDPDAYPNLLSMMESYLEKYKNEVAFIFMGKTLTYGQLDQYSHQFGAYLQMRGLKPGDRIALMMPNMLQFPIALIGAMRAGLVVVNTNPLYTPREMKHQFNDAGVKAVVIAENFASNLQSIIKETSIEIPIITSIGGMLGIKGWFVNFVIRRIKKMVPHFQLPTAVSFNKALHLGKQHNLQKHYSEPNDPIILQYTGGTTGVSKGAMLTNRNMVSNMQQIRALMSPYLEERSETALCALPLYHIFAFTVNCLCFMSVGGKNLMIVNARDLKSMMKEMKKYPVTIITGVNTLFNALLNDPDFDSVPFEQLKLTCGGGMAVQKAVAERWQLKTGCNLVEGFGMTETSPVASVNPFDGTHRLGSIGIPVPSTDMRIVDEQKNPVAQGEVGEIQVKGPQVMKGYWQRPEATAETISADGWLSTGDIGLMQADGFFQIVDRKKDMILVSGFNVYPNEIEEVLATHPKVMESAAVGMPDEKSGELVKIFVVKKDPSLTEAELIAFCRENLTGYKCPKAVVFRDELPKTNVGKILRRALRDEQPPA